MGVGYGITQIKITSVSGKHEMRIKEYAFSINQDIHND